MAHRNPCATRFPGGTLFSGSYEPIKTPAWVDGVKHLAPPSARSYNPLDKTWFVAFTYADQALALFRQLWPHAEVRDARGAGTPPPRRPGALAAERHYAVLHLLPSAPPEVVDAAYRALVKRHHPDRLPAGERERATRVTQELNAAREALMAAGAA